MHFSEEGSRRRKGGLKGTGVNNVWRENSKRAPGREEGFKWTGKGNGRKKKERSKRRLGKYGNR
jgi:hypothetical protein